MRKWLLNIFYAPVYAKYSVPTTPEGGGDWGMVPHFFA